MRRWPAAIGAVALVATACSSSTTGHGASRTTSASVTSLAPPAVAPLLPLHATTGAHPGVFDSEDRQVRLRGVNVNSLGDYYQDDPALPTVVPVTNQDWASMAAHGFDVVRLLVSWSKLEPRHGAWDTKYIATVQRTVDTAARYGIYSVIDMHQDAWGKYIASPKGVHCTNGGTPAIGWDGAPKWATFTNGTDTCAHGSREMSDAVETAWDSFYANRNGIMDALTETWGVLARQFAEDPAVAGYDLLNEPNHGHDSDTALRALAGYYGNTIRVIREQERAVASPRAAQHHIVFFEDTVFGSVVAPGFTKDTNIVFAPHNYGESIGAIPIEAEFDYYAAAARTYKTAMWIGEYGWFSDPTASAAKVQRFAAKADALLDVGEAWWQWRQACGDPHSIGQPGGKPPSVLIHFQRNACPGDHNLGVVPQWQCTWRPYPLAAPGRLTSLKTGCSNDLEVQGTTAKPGTLEIWFPGHTVPRISGATKGHTTPVPGGFRVSAQVSGTYRVSVAAR